MPNNTISQVEVNGTTYDLLDMNTLSAVSAIERRVTALESSVDQNEQETQQQLENLSSIIPGSDFNTDNTVKDYIDEKFDYTKGSGISNNLFFDIVDDFPEVFPFMQEEQLQGCCQDADNFYISFSRDNVGVYIQKINKTTRAITSYSYSDLNVVNSLVHKNGKLYGASRHTDGVYVWDASTMAFEETIPLNGVHCNNLAIDYYTGGWIAMNNNESTNRFSFVFMDENFNLTKEVQCTSALNPNVMTNGIATIGDMICTSIDGSVPAIAVFNRDGVYGGVSTLLRKTFFTSEIESFESDGRNLYVYTPCIVDYSVIVIKTQPIGGFAYSNANTFDRPKQNSIGAILLLAQSHMATSIPIIGGTSFSVDQPYAVWNTFTLREIEFRNNISFAIKRQISGIDFLDCLFQGSVYFRPDASGITTKPIFSNCTLCGPIVTYRNNPLNVTPRLMRLSKMYIPYVLSDTSSFKTMIAQCDAGTMVFASYSQASFAASEFTYADIISQSGTSVPLFLYDGIVWHA